MLSKLFKRKSVPKNDGDSVPSHIEKLNYVKVFELELSNMEDSPVYTLTHQLSVGSEIGNIIINDPSVSPRHASFILQQDVVSVIDHGSVEGTYVNGKKIPAGKYVILEESDTILVGELEIKLRASRASVAKSTVEEELSEDSDETEAVEDVEEAPPEVNEKADIQEEKLKSQKVEYYRPPQKKENAAPAAAKKKDKPKGKKKTLNLSAPQPAANALIRVLAIASDLILSYAFIIILTPFDEFRDFLGFVPELLSSLVDIDWNAIWALISEDYDFAAGMLQDGYKFISEIFDFIPLLIVFICLRIVSTFIFGVSLSELMLGMRATGNGIWARFGGVLRVLIGVVTWPLIIFDLPALISRRSFKEVLTFTRIENPSKFLSILGIIFYIPFTVAFVFVAPLFQGFDPPEPIMISDKIDQRVKAKVPVAPKPEEGTEVNEAPAAPVEAPAVSAISNTLHFKISYNPEELRIMPDFKFRGVKSKLNVSSTLIFYQRDLQRPVEVEVFKKFDLKQLMSFGMKGNVFLFEKYPEIYNYVYESKDKNPAFNKQKDKNIQKAFANEFIRFTQVAFSLSLDNVLQIMEEETPLIKGLVDYKASFLSLLEYKDFDEIGFAKIGDLVFMRISFLKQKPFDLLIPLVKGDGVILKVTFDKKENFKTTQSKFYKYNLNETKWYPEKEEKVPHGMNATEVFDLFSNENFKNIFKSSELAQKLYAYYFETSSLILQKTDPAELKIWKENVQSLSKVLVEIPTEEAAPDQTEIKEKLLQNFRDMLDALESSNLEYFGVSATKTI